MQQNTSIAKTKQKLSIHQWTMKMWTVNSFRLYYQVKVLNTLFIDADERAGSYMGSEWKYPTLIVSWKLVRIITSPWCKKCLTKLH